VYDHGQQILDALAKDRYGIAVSNIRYAGPDVKPLALGLKASGPFYQATKQTLVEHTYPLARTIPAFIDRAPGAPVDPKLREFLRYLLSREGQRAITEDGRYLPLSAATIAEQSRKLESASDEPLTANAPTAISSPPSRAGARVLRIWGPEPMGEVIKYWARGFRRLHPEISVEPRLMGSATAIPGLYSGQADIALLGREDNGTDDGGFSRPKGYVFQRLELMRGSLDVEDKSAALAVLVQRDNPVSQLTMRQLAAVLGCDGVNGMREARTWGELGAAGRWAHKPVHLYTYDTESGTGLFLVRAVLGSSRKVSWDRVTDFKDIQRSDGSVYRASEQIVDVLYKDPYGIAVSNLRYASDRLKVVAIAAVDAGPFVVPTRETVRAGLYPLARSTYAFIDRPPGKPIDPTVKAFLRYTLSAAGQSDLMQQSDYLPLSTGAVSAESAKLDP
jgi:phosphate transport system substrate-binding protein